MSQNRWNELPPDQAAKKIDDWLIDSAHMRRIMIRKSLNDDEKRGQARNFNNYITSSGYQAELEHRREVDRQIRGYCSG